MNYIFFFLGALTAVKAQAPTPVPTIELGCDICAGRPITQPDAIVPGQGFGPDISCTESVENSVNIPTVVCPLVQDFTIPICCPPTEAPTASPTLRPTIELGCDICGGLPITRPDAIVPGQGFGPDISCTESVENSVNIPTAVCPLVQDFTIPICCAPTDPPTDIPTPAPSARPTVQPTDQPTVRPTERPTGSPTDRPSLAPTRTPLPPPTPVPTANPTFAPVPLPTISPVPQCLGYNAACFEGSDCCSDRCVLNTCQKAIRNDRVKLSAGRGGAAGAPKERRARRGL